MYELIASGSSQPLEYESLFRLHKDLCLLVCKSCNDSSSSLSQLLKTGCGGFYKVLDTNGMYLYSDYLEHLYELEIEDTIQSAGVQE